MRGKIAGWTAAGVLSCAAAAAVLVPPLLPASTPPTTITAAGSIASAGSVADVSGQVLATARAHLHASTRAATAASHCALGSAGLERARQLSFYQRDSEARELLGTLLESDCVEAMTDRDMARFQLAYLSSRAEDHEGTLAALEGLEEEIPVADFAEWLRGEALFELGRFDEATLAFASIYDAGDSPLHHRARARQARSLVSAERWEEALPLLEENARTFPDYPRRHRVLHEIGVTLEALERLDEAAEAHQRAHFEFPYKREGQASLQRLQALEARGHRATPISPNARFDSYRQLSVDKFWPLAHDLLTQLRQDVATEEGTSELENRILLQLAMNSYNAHDFQTAVEYFAEARRIFEAGHRRGFQERTLYRFNSFSLARLGLLEEAIESLEFFHRNSSRRDRVSEIAYHHERLGEYERAFQLYDSIYTAAQKRGWHYSYLLYKTGRFEEAYESLRDLAARSRGENRAKYLYWTARALERAGNNEEAHEVFREVQTAHRTSYYGVQARNRIMDLEQRVGMDDLMLVETDLMTREALAAFDDPGLLASAEADPRAQPRTPSGDPPVDASAGDGDAATSGSSFTRQALRSFCQEESECMQAYSRVVRGVGFIPAPEEFQFAFPAPPRLGDTDEEFVEGLDRRDAPQGRVPAPGVLFPENNVPAISYSTEGRIYWDGRRGSDLSFVNFDRGQMLGPVPRLWTAYDDETHIGGLEEAIALAGDLFPNLERARWLYMANWNTEARRVIRDVSLEFRALSSRSRPGAAPHELPHKRWAYYIDNRRRAQRAELWGMQSDELRFPVPESAAGRRALLQRQQAIVDQRREIEPVLVKALQEVGDYHLVRRHALGNTWWLRHPPRGDARRFWAMAYPRAFPEKVIPLAREHNINPYMIWALMLVESSFNPDSLSIANAKGLLQVIPRTGLKIADLFGSEDFGPFDLLEEDHSIEQGIFYFSRLVQKFHGQELLAFAGYNGGPHRVGGWLDNRGHRIPLDEFIEEIPFDESRGYAKKVLRFLHIYLQIYEGYDDGLYVGQNVRRDYLEQPDF